MLENLIAKTRSFSIGKSSRRRRQYSRGVAGGYPCGGMTNDQTRMTNEVRMTNGPRHSGLGLGHSLVILVWSLGLLFTSSTRAEDASMPQVAIAIHGGAGVIERANLSPEREAAYRAKLEEALRAGRAILLR